MDLTSSLGTLLTLAETTPDESQRPLFESAVAALNRATGEDITHAVTRASDRTSVIWALLALPDRDVQGGPLARLSDDVIRTAVEAAQGASPRFRTLGLLPPRLTRMSAAQRVSERAWTAFAEIRACPTPSERIEGWQALLEHVEGTFENEITASLEAIGGSYVSTLGEILRGPVAAVVRALTEDLSITPSVDRHAVFLRIWKVLRHGWIEVLLHAPAEPGTHRDDSALLASLASTPELARAWSSHLATEPASTLAGFGMRRLRFELAERAGDADVMRQCLPGKSTTWVHHEAIARALGAREAIAYLEALPPSADRDRALLALLRRDGEPSEALAKEVILPHTLDALAQKYGVSHAQLIARGITNVRRGDEPRWLEFLAQRGDGPEAKKMAQRCGPDVLLRVATRPLPAALKTDLLSKAIDALFATRTAWKDASDAARIGREVLDAASEGPARTKLLARARAKVSKALDGHDYFSRELAIALERVLDELDPG